MVGSNNHIPFTPINNNNNQNPFVTPVEQNAQNGGHLTIGTTTPPTTPVNLPNNQVFVTPIQNNNPINLGFVTPNNQPNTQHIPWAPIQQNYHNGITPPTTPVNLPNNQVFVTPIQNNNLLNLGFVTPNNQSIAPQTPGTPTHNHPNNPGALITFTPFTMTPPHDNTHNHFTSLTNDVNRLGNYTSPIIHQSLTSVTVGYDSGTSTPSISSSLSSNTIIYSSTPTSLDEDAFIQEEDDTTVDLLDNSDSSSSISKKRTISQSSSGSEENLSDDNNSKKTKFSDSEDETYDQYLDSLTKILESDELENDNTNNLALEDVTITMNNALLTTPGIGQTPLANNINPLMLTPQDDYDALEYHFDEGDLLQLFGAFLDYQG